MAANGIFLTDEQRMIRDMARDFAEGELAPHAGKWDLNGGYPDDMLGRMGQLGLMGMLVAARMGRCRCRPRWPSALAMEEIAAGDVGTSTAMSVNNSLVCAGILKGGSEEQKERFLRPLARGDMLGCFCLPDRAAGGARMRRTCAPVRWRTATAIGLNGTKQFVSSGSRADIAMVFAVTDPDAGKKGISCFLVPTDSGGYTVASHEIKMGQRAHDTCQIVFEDVRVTPDLMLGEPGQGYAIALGNLEGGRIGGSPPRPPGAMRAAYEAALDYAKERTSFGKPLIEHQAVGFRLADMATEIRGVAAAHAAGGRACAMPASPA